MCTYSLHAASRNFILANVQIPMWKQERKKEITVIGTTENIHIIAVMNGHELCQNIDEKKIARATLKIWTKLFFGSGFETHSEKRNAREAQTTEYFAKFFSKPPYSYYILFEQVWV